MHRALGCVARGRGLRLLAATPSTSRWSWRSQSAAAETVRFEDAAPARPPRKNQDGSARGWAGGERGVRETDFQRAVFGLDQRLRRNGTLQFHFVRSALGLLGEGERVSQMEGAFLLRATGNYSYDAVPEQRAQLTQTLWDLLPRHGVVRNATFYNIRMQVNLENGVDFSPSELLAEMEAEGHAANRVTYQRIIAQYAHKGDIAAASEVLAQMKEAGMPVTEFTYQALVFGHAKNGHIAQAKDLMEGLRSARGGSLSLDAWTHLVAGAVAGGEEAAVLEALETMAASELRFSSTEAAELYRAALVAGLGKASAALRPLLDAQQHSYADKQRLASALIARHGRLDEALDLVRSNRSEELDPGHDAARFPGRGVVHALVSSRLPVDEVRKFLVTLEAEGLHPEPLTHFRGLVFASDSALHFLPVIVGPKGDPDFRQHFLWPAFRQAAAQGKDRLKAAVAEALALGADLSDVTLGRFVFSAGRVALRLPEVLPLYPQVEEWRRKKVHHAAIFGAVLSGRVAEAAELLKAPDAADFPARLIFELRSTNAFPRLLMGGEAGKDNDKVREAASVLCALVKSSGDSGRMGPILASLTASENFTHRHQRLTVEAVSAAGLSLPPGQVHAIRDKLGGSLTVQSHQDLEAIAQQFAQEGQERSARGEGRWQRGRQQSAEKTVDGRELVAGAQTEAEARALQQRLAAELTAHQVGSVPWLRAASRFIYVVHKTSRDADAADQVLQQFPQKRDSEKSMVLEMMAREGKKERAMELYRSLPSIDRIKMGWLLHCLVVRGDVAEAMQLAKTMPVPLLDVDPQRERLTQDATPVRHMLRHMVRTSTKDEMAELREALVGAGLASSKGSATLEPFVLWHLHRDDVDGALAEFHRIYTSHSLPAGQVPLYTALLRQAQEQGDVVERSKEDIQAIFDACQDSLGQGNAMADLVVALIRVGQTDRASRVLSRPQFAPNPRHLQYLLSNILHCGSAEQAVTELEGWLEAARMRGGWDQRMSSEQRSLILHHLVTAYRDAGHTDKLSGMWERMEELDMYPDTGLAEHLSKAMVGLGAAAPESLSDAQKDVFAEQAQRQKRREDAQRKAQQLAQAAESRPAMAKSDAAVLEMLKAGQLEEAVAELRRAGRGMERAAYELAVVQCGRKGRLDLALEAMELAAVEPTRRVRRNVLTGGILSIAGRQGTEPALQDRLLAYLAKHGLDKDAEDLRLRIALSNGQGPKVIEELEKTVVGGAGLNLSLFMAAAQSSGESFDKALAFAKSSSDSRLGRCLWRVADTPEQLAQLKEWQGADNLAHNIPDILTGIKSHEGSKEATEARLKVLEEALSAESGDKSRAALARLTSMRVGLQMSHGDTAAALAVLADAKDRLHLDLPDLSIKVLRALYHILEKEEKAIPAQLHTFVTDGFRQEITLGSPAADPSSSSSSSSDEETPAPEKASTEEAPASSQELHGAEADAKVTEEPEAEKTQPPPESKAS